MYSPTVNEVCLPGPIQKWKRVTVADLSDMMPGFKHLCLSLEHCPSTKSKSIATLISSIYFQCAETGNTSYIVIYTSPCAFKKTSCSMTGIAKFHPQCLESMATCHITTWYVISQLVSVFCPTDIPCHVIFAQSSSCPFSLLETLASPSPWHQQLWASNSIREKYNSSNNISFYQ